ncbi:MAG: GAF domain-containing protein, partial [Acetobacteraceae bacterium]|nr:GAF domain-containing protein [Acetobacteraceae bacterium]
MADGAREAGGTGAAGTALSRPASWPLGGGEMAARIRAHDWVATPLGPAEAWPPALKVAVQLVLAQSYATNVCVGPSRTLIYNDAYARMIGAKHPGALGQDVREAFAEVRFASTLARAFAGETVALVDQPYPFRRHVEVEPAWFDISYSPLRDERGKVFAAFVLHKETTGRVLAERALRESEARQTFLLRLSDALRPLADPVEVQGTAARLLGERLRASRAYYYEFNEDTATGRVHGEHPPGERASLVGTDAAAGWPTVHAAMRAGESLALPDAANSPRLTEAERASFGGLGFRALACVPLVKAGRLVAVLNVAR